MIICSFRIFVCHEQKLVNFCFQRERVMQSYTVHTCTRTYIVCACTYVYNTSGPWNLMLSGHADYQFCVLHLYQYHKHHLWSQLSCLLAYQPHVTNHNYIHREPFYPLNTDSESALPPHHMVIINLSYAFKHISPTLTSRNKDLSS